MDIHRFILRGDPIKRFVNMPLGDLLLKVLKKHDKNVILVDSLTNEKLQANVILNRGIKLAKWFRSQGIRTGDSVSTNSENRLEFAITPVSTYFVGATFAPLSPDYTPTELKHALSLSKPKIVFGSEKTIDKMVSMLPAHPYIQNIVLFGSTKYSHPKVLNFSDILEDDREEDKTFKVTPVDNMKETVATILCSSGTTGLPKGVMCTHENIGAFVDITGPQLDHPALNEGSDDVMMGLTPFYHAFGFVFMFLNLVRGKKMVVMSKFNLENFLEVIAKYKVQRLMVPPPVLLYMLKSPLTDKYDLSSIKEIRCGASALSRDKELEIRKRFNDKKVSQAYGSTEALGVLVNPAEKPAKLGSVGKIVDGMSVKVIDKNGEPQGPHQEGELCFKGPLIMKGYVGDPKATADTIDKDGWLHTGDLAYYDEEGYFFIVDRLKELIKYKGFQVAPAELETLLLTHPSIEDAGVVGLPDEDAGELPVAFVVKKPGLNVTEEELKKLVADTLSHQKQLRGGVFFVDKIPRSENGKILRKELRGKFKENGQS